jgi:phage recombination protein Bet
MTELAVVPQANQPQKHSLLRKVADRYSVEPDKMLVTLKHTAFKGDVSNEQMMALLIVADQYQLNPWTKEIYAFPDKQNSIVPVVGVDGWARIINTHPQFDGMEFEQDEDSCTCRIYRKDRGHAIAVTEYLSECKRNTQPWGSHPRRMLRHKAMIQAARLAFGFVGIYDQDEAERIVEASPAVTVEAVPVEEPTQSRTAAIKDKIKAGRKQADKPRAPTYAEIADKLNTAGDIDTLDVAASLISAVVDEIQQAELTAMYREIRTQMEAEDAE